MKRKHLSFVFVGFVVITLLCSVGTVSAASNNSTAPNNTTTQIHHLKQENVQLRKQMKTYRNQRNHYHERVQNLTNQLNSKESSFSPSQVKYMDTMGAHYPNSTRPAVFIVKDNGFGPVAYEYVGPGNGVTTQHPGGASFNGQDAWIRVSIKKPNKVMRKGAFTWHLKYAPPGMNTTYTSTSIREYRRQLTHIKKKLNTPGGSMWVLEYENGLYHQNRNQKNYAGIMVGIPLGLLASAFVLIYESQTGKFTQWRRKRSSDRRYESIWHRLWRRFRP